MAYISDKFYLWYCIYLCILLLSACTVVSNCVNSEKSEVKPTDYSIDQGIIDEKKPPIKEADFQKLNVGTSPGETVSNNNKE